MVLFTAYGTSFAIYDSYDLCLFILVLLFARPTIVTITGLTETTIKVGVKGPLKISTNNVIPLILMFVQHLFYFLNDVMKTISKREIHLIVAR